MHAGIGCAGKTGDVRYSERLSNRGEGFTASPVSDGRHLFFTSELGHAYVIPAQPGFAETSKSLRRDGKPENLPPERRFRAGGVAPAA